MSRRRRPPLFGPFPEPEARALLKLLLAAGVEARVGFDRDFARLHKEATAFRPKLRRRSGFSDVKSGWVVRVPTTQEDAARAAVEGTRFAPQAAAPAPSAEEFAAAAAELATPTGAPAPPRWRWLWTLLGLLFVLAWLAGRLA